MPDRDTLRQAALRLLARREHSRAELARKLAGQAESAEALDQMLDGLVAEHLLSDARFAQQRLQQRARRYGNQRLQQELRLKGIDDSEIEAALADQESELERCRAVWTRKFGTLPDSPEALAKQQRFLQYRGFSRDTIRQILRESAE